MSDLFNLTGSYNTQPASGAPSADPQVVSTAISESMELALKDLGEYSLTTDSPVDVDFGGLGATGANLVFVKVTSGGKVKLALTSTDGSLQGIPVDGYFQLITNSVAITAAQLTRTPGTLTTVKVFLGQAAP